ncbi:hypothetical protein LR48_Vigan06g021700 [Vigna angularis]|uniref:Uncharacterized protein n=1 Tax=Phaseolus angularis TaxID=3914 RepID=A0A0L9UQC4_PHAAN|nr:hypothetical protein LR48_Vigan06g021700 [Vigna angularis]
MNFIHRVGTPSTRVTITLHEVMTPHSLPQGYDHPPRGFYTSSTSSIGLVHPPRGYDTLHEVMTPHSLPQGYDTLHEVMTPHSLLQGYDHPPRAHTKTGASIVGPRMILVRPELQSSHKGWGIPCWALPDPDSPQIFINPSPPKLGQFVNLT